MKTKTLRIPVKKDRVSFLSDPTGQGHNTIYAYVKVSDLPMDIPMDVNPRAQNTESRVARQIQGGLLENAREFHLLNRGMTMTAYDAEYVDKTGTLNLQVASGVYGLVDGGHTYAVIRKNLAPYMGTGVDEKLPKGEKPAKGEVEVEKPQPDNGTVKVEEERPEFLDESYVRLEVLVGVKNGLLVDLARSRNTSAQVKDESLANLEGSFDWLKEILGRQPYGEQIAYKENEDDEKFPIDIREVIALLTLFHPNFQDSEKPPIMGYTSKGRCLDLFRDNAEQFQMLKPIVPDVLRLYDYIHLKFADIYREIGGFTGIGDDAKPTRKGIKLAKVSGVKSFKDGFPLYYIGEKGNFLFPDGWLMPVVSALRAVVSYQSTVAKWKANPFQFFDKTGKALVQMTLETSLTLGRNPNAVGKHKPHWVQLHAHELNQYLKLLNVNTEQEVNVR